MMGKLLPRSLPPRSLLGQVMLALAIGLIAGQAISAVLLYRAAEQRRETALVNAIALQLVMSEHHEAMEMPGRHDRAQLRERRQSNRLAHARLDPEVRMRIEQSPGFALQQGEERIAHIERDLREVLETQDVLAHEILVTERLARDDRYILSRPRLQARLEDGHGRNRKIIVAAIQNEAGGSWQIVRVPHPRAPARIFTTIALQTLVTFAVLFLLLFLLLRRITRPLAQLTARVDRFARQPEEVIAMEAIGPQDIRLLIEAHNAMAARIGAMLSEKDVMLGAIGHDLKTPLAALRVRIESVEDGEQRARMAQGIEDITATLDDILSLARVGRPSDRLEPTELCALVAGVVEEFEDMGDDVVLRSSHRIALPLRSTWIRRALRNLVGNALRYGQRARVDVVQEGDFAVVLIDDDGPGIPDHLIETMMQPFQRGEVSRNRATGGAGLGLTLARAIAQQHGGRLVLSNRPEGGLRAELFLPIE
ncbi:MAG TPA: ATP-binding protein [Paracoccaceae bacterium]